MIQALAGAQFPATLEGAPTGLAGTVGVKILNLDGTTYTARTTAGITEIATGMYEKTNLTAPSAAGNYLVVWDTGGATPTVASENLLVTPVPANTRVATDDVVVADRAGNVQAGRDVHVYFRGTTTPVPVYDAATGGTAFTGTLTTDADGYIVLPATGTPGWVDPGSFDVVAVGFGRNLHWEAGTASGMAPIGAAGGDLRGNFPNPTLSRTTLAGVTDGGGAGITGIVVTPDNDTQSGMIVRRASSTYGSAQVEGQAQAFGLIAEGSGTFDSKRLWSVDGYTGRVTQKHPSFDRTQVDGSGVWTSRVGGMRLGGYLNAPGTGVTATANEAVAVTFGVVPQITATVDYEKIGHYVVMESYDDDSTFFNGVVAIDARGVAGVGTVSAHVKGITATAKILAGGEGHGTAIESIVDNAGVDVSDPGATNAKFGYHVTTQGASNASAGIKFGILGSSTFHKGIWALQGHFGTGASDYFMELNTASGATPLWAVKPTGGHVIRPASDVSGMRVARHGAADANDPFRVEKDDLATAMFRVSPVGRVLILPDGDTQGVFITRGAAAGAADALKYVDNDGTTSLARITGAGKGFFVGLDAASQKIASVAAATVSTDAPNYGQVPLSGGGTGIAVRTGTDAWSARSIAAGTGISVSNADGTAGNPSVAINTSVVPQLAVSNVWTKGAQTFQPDTDTNAIKIRRQNDAGTGPYILGRNAADSATIWQITNAGQGQFAGLSLTDATDVVLGTTTGTKIGTSTTQKLAFFNSTPIVKPTASGSRGGNAALASLLTQLAALGLIVDSTTV